MEVKYQDGNQVRVNYVMVDAMSITGNLRWANQNGEQNQSDAGPLLGFRSDVPCKVVVKGGGESLAFQSLTFAETDGEYVYLAGDKFIDKVEGTIVRVRKQTI